MVTFVRRFEPLADDALDGLAQRAAVAMVSTNFAKSTGKLLTFEAATMAGNKAMKIIATGLVGDGRVHQTSFMIMAIHNGNPVGVQFSCDVDMYDKVLPEVNALVQTLKWRD